MNPSGSQFPSVPLQIWWITCSQVAWQVLIWGHERTPRRNILECLLKQLCDTSLPTAWVPSVQPTAPEGGTPSSLVLVFWMCSQLCLTGQQTHPFLLLPVSPVCYLPVESCTEGCSRSQCPSCHGTGSACSTLPAPLVTDLVKRSS